MVPENGRPDPGLEYYSVHNNNGKKILIERSYSMYGIVRRVSGVDISSHVRLLFEIFV